MVSLVVLSAMAGGVVLGGTAAALDGSVVGTYPLTPGSNTLGTYVFVARPGDNVAQSGIKKITLRADAGSFENVTEKDVFVVVRGGKRIEIGNTGEALIDVSGINVSSSNGGDRLTITLPRPVRPRFASDSPNTGAEVAIKFDNFTTPKKPGSYPVEGTLSTASGATDGPVSVSYTVSSPELSMENQSVSQFSKTQEVNVSAAIPAGGYVGVFKVAPNGSPGKLVGSTNTSTASPGVKNYSIDVSGNISESQQLMAVAYTESSGRSSGLRAGESFDPTEDDPLVVNGNLVNATASISTLDVDGRVEAGNEYDQGAKLYFSQGDSSTSYQIRTVKNGELGPSATQFQTAPNGTAIIDTTELEQGQYAISRVDDDSLVSLDNDSTTAPGDDSFFVSGKQMTTTGGGATATEDGSAATENGGNGGGDATEGGTASGGSNESGGNGDGGSSGFGPGFGPVVAVLALLAAALLAVRRDR